MGHQYNQIWDIPAVIAWAIVTVFSVIPILIFLIVYIYYSVCLMFIAKKTNTGNAWLAWIPIVNIFLVLKIAKKPAWWIFLLLIPLVNIVLGIIIWMEIAKARNKPDWLGVLIVIPVVGFFIPLYLAFSD